MSITPVAQRPRTIPLPEVSESLGISLRAVKRAIAQDTEDRLPDDIRRIPGGRVEGASYYVIRRQFEAVAGSGEPLAPVVIHRRRETG